MLHCDSRLVILVIFENGFFWLVNEKNFFTYPLEDLGYRFIFIYN